MNNKRTIFMISGGMDTLLGGIALMIYFGWIPVDIGIEKRVIGLIGAFLFFSGLAIFTFFFLKNNQE
ncbi:MAG: hypothetical protein IT311_01520 [Anaerolineales bacterium]|nr:hypothetical protein [Anaerolineales bacterium]MCZ2122400.1 hypothetical protein [Anaerolineales bacterium]